MKPSEAEQQEALLAAMADILWNIGEKLQVTVALPGEVPHIVHSHTYFQDSVTEKVSHYLTLKVNFCINLIIAFPIPNDKTGGFANIFEASFVFRTFHFISFFFLIK